MWLTPPQALLPFIGRVALTQSSFQYQLNPKNFPRGKRCERGGHCSLQLPTEDCTKGGARLFLEVHGDRTRSNRLRLQQGKFQRGYWEERAVHQPAPSAFIPPGAAVCPSAEGAHPWGDSRRAPGIPASPLAPTVSACSGQLSALPSPPAVPGPARWQPSHTHRLFQARADREVREQRLYLHFDHHASPAAAPRFPWLFGQLKGHARLRAGLDPLHVLLLRVAARLPDIQAEPASGKRDKPV